MEKAEGSRVSPPTQQQVPWVLQHSLRLSSESALAARSPEPATACSLLPCAIESTDFDVMVDG